MATVEPTFCHRRFVWMSKPYVPVVLLYSNLLRSTSLSDLHLTTHAGYAVNPRIPQSQVVLHRAKETGHRHRRQANTSTDVSGQDSAGSAMCRLDMLKKRDRGGASLPAWWF
jgi:hypothetical protein